MKSLELLRVPDFRRFWLARTTSFVGDQIGQTTLLIVAASSGPGQVATILLAFTLPRLLGPACGALADLFPMRTLMLSMDVVQLICFLALAIFALPFPVVVSLVVVATLANTIFLPAGRKTYPRMISIAQFPIAARAMGTSFTLGFAAGPAIAGALASIISAPSVLAVNALSFLVSIALLLRTPQIAPDPTSEHRPGYLVALRRGAQAVASSPILRVLLPAFAALVAVAAFDNAALPLLAQQQLSHAGQLYGFLLSAFGVGMIAGSLLGDRLGGRRGPLVAWVVSQAIFGLGTLVTGVGPVVWLAFIGQFAAGVGNGATVICVDILLQREVPPRTLGAANGITMSIPFVSSSLTYVAAGVILEYMLPSTLLVVAGFAVFVVIALVARPLARRSQIPASDSNSAP